MTKFLTKRNAILASVAGVILIGGFAIAESRGGDVTLDDMLEKVGERFDEADTDGNGIITEAEAEAAQAAHLADMATRLNERLAAQFERMDADDDGIVSEGDRGFGRLSDRLDLSGDLTLDQIQAAAEDKIAQRAADRELERGEDQPTFPQTRDEALASAQERFEAADADGDGTLSRDERPDRGHGGKRGGDRGNR